MQQNSLFQKEPDRTLTVSEYAEYINGLVSIEPVLVEGEVSNFRDIPGRNFCYFDIKDENATARCFQGFWNSKKVELENGTLVKIFGYPSLQKNGTFVIDVREVMLVGEGALMQAYLKLKEKLEKEGLFGPQFKKDLPQFPKIVGLVAGKNSSAYHDVVAELTERWGGSDVFFLASRVQGSGAKRGIIEAIRFFNQEHPVDVLILARGGGSIEDLQAFDCEEVVREIFASKIPLISAIGHEDHWTLSDFVSDVRAKTPTKAAQIAVPDRKEIAERLDYYAQRSEQIVNQKIHELNHELNLYLNSTAGALGSSIERANLKTQQLQQRLTDKIRQILERKKESLTVLEKTLTLLNPLNVLSRGYAVIEKDGKKVVSVGQIEKGDEIAGRLHDGKFVGKIEDVTS